MHYGFFGKGKWGVAVNNVMGTLKGTRKINGAMTDYSGALPVTSTLGVNLNSDVPFIGDLNWAVDYKFVSPSKSFFKNTTMGIEKAVWGDILKLRAGVNQGYIVGGLGIDIGFFSLSYAKYTSEAGSEIGVEPREMNVLEGSLFF